MANTKSTVKLSKAELIMMLADFRVDSYPELYGRRPNGTAEHYDSAKKFVNFDCPTKRSMITACYAFGLIPFTVEVC